ncbi:MAG: transposase [Candidatus Acidiferrum sp.]|jgi:hypothetical protein
MIMQDLVDRFEQRKPACVMARALLENVLSPERLDGIFTRYDHAQTGQLMFSSLVEIMGLVATRIKPSVHAAYQDQIEEVGVTVKAVYDKLQRVKPCVSQALVRQTAARMVKIVDAMKNDSPELLPGYRVKILDGNHLRRTERRLGVLRELNVAPLPGHALVVLDPRRKLLIDVFPCEDAHAQERTLLAEVLETVEPADVWIADRNFCTTCFLLGLHGRRAFFVIRRHLGSLRGELIGNRTAVGTGPTGKIYEQRMRVVDNKGMATNIRCISIALDEPTRDGDTEMEILTNLPSKVTALKIAELYRKRWSIETAFQEVAANLNGELVTLGYPKAALFAFCSALVAYNVLSVLRAAMESIYGHETVEQSISTYYLALEVSGAYEGMMVAIGEKYWTKTYRDLTPSEMARELVRIAGNMNPARYRKHKRSTKPNRAKLKKKGRQHKSTARLLNSAKQTK